MNTELKLKIDQLNGRSEMTDSYFTSPLKLGVPRRENDVLKIIMMSSSPGLLQGDTFNYDIVCGEGTKAMITEQSYSKIFDTGAGRACKDVMIRLESMASLYYNPCAVIPFKGSTYEGNMRVYLDQDSEFACCDIVTCGRVGMGERFEFIRYRNRVCVYVDNIPVWLDNCLLEPGTMSLTELAFFDGYTHQGTFYYYGSPEKEAALAAIEADETAMLGVSRASKGICIRILARTAQDIEDIFIKFEDILGLN